MFSSAIRVTAYFDPSSLIFQILCTDLEQGVFLLDRPTGGLDGREKMHLAAALGAQNWSHYFDHC